MNRIGLDIRNLIILIFLAAAGIHDIRSKSVPVSLIAAMAVSGIMGITMHIWADSFLPIHSFAGILPGIGLLLLGKCSNQAIGYGDGWIVLVLGIYLTIWEVLEIILWSLGSAAVCAGILLGSRRRQKEQEIAFIPFLIIGFVIWKALEHM